MDRETNHFYEFGPFRVDPRRQLLLRDGQPVPLTAKAFETLLVLMQHGEKMVSKDELMKQLWPDTFVEESNLTQHVSMLRKALGESPQDHRYIVTMPGKGYRFAQKVREVSDGPEGNALLVQSHSVQRVTVEQTESTQHSVAVNSLARVRHTNLKWVLGTALTAALLTVLIFYVVRMRRTPPLHEADLVLVSDFVNTTGEPVFDGTLKQALTVKLAESPFFNIAQDSDTRKTLGLMGRRSDERVVSPVAREVCQREGAKAVVGGSILSLGNKYEIHLDATNCLTGASLTRQQVEAPDKEQVLSKLGELIPALRRKLGESVGSIEKFNTPMEQATTKSLAALKAYTSGDESRARGKEAESIPFYKMAIELDPDFAIAYARLGAVHLNLSQADHADDYMRQAFERRAHVSGREKFYIQAHYYENTARDYDKANDTYKLWTEVYPHDFTPINSLASGYLQVGQLENAIAAGQQALRVNPHQSLSYASLGRAFERATRFAEAKAICEKAIAEKADSYLTHVVLYRIAFAEEDEPVMQREVAWFKGKPQEGTIIYHQAKAALSRGELRNAKELFERTRAIAQQKGSKELVAAIFSGQAQFEADLGIAREARAGAELALREMPDSLRHRAWATLPFARAGDTQRTEALMNELNKQPTPGTLLNEILFPSIRAAVDLDRRNPAAAIEELRRALPYDLCVDAAGMTLYYRGLAYLELKSGKEAAAQFQKILDNRGVVINDIYWPLARLGLARAYAQTGESEKSLAQYRELLAFWKNADPDLRLLKDVKAEYKKLSERSASAVQ